VGQGVKHVVELGEEEGAEAEDDNADNRVEHSTKDGVRLWFTFLKGVRLLERSITETF
jgi:hypothetical protein